MYQNIEAGELSQQSQAARDQYYLVDVRTEEEYQAGHIPGSIHIPHDQIAERYIELTDQKEQNILLICRSGRRSVFAAEILHDKGFKRLYNLEGGMLQWTGEVAE